MPQLHGSRFKDLTGQKFGRLNVIQIGERGDRRDQHTYWLCRCDCGRERIVQSSNLTSGKSTSCRRCPQRMPEGEPARNSLLFSYKYQAQRRGYSWELTGEEFDKLISANCHYCGLMPSTVHTSRSHEITHNGIDRVNNVLGYIPGNVVSCCGTCNYVKGTMSVDEFLTWATRFAAYQVQLQDKKL